MREEKLRWTLRGAAILLAVQALAQLLALGADPARPPGALELAAAFLQSLLAPWKEPLSASRPGLCLSWALRGALAGSALDLMRRSGTWLRAWPGRDPRLIWVFIATAPFILSAAGWQHRAAPAGRVMAAAEAWVGGGSDDTQAASRRASPRELEDLKAALRAPLRLLLVEPGLALTRGTLRAVVSGPREVRFIGPGLGLNLQSDGVAYTLHGRGYPGLPLRIEDPAARARVHEILFAPLP